MLKVIPVPALQDNYIWLLLDKHEKYAAVIDPGDATPVVHWLQERKIQLIAILLTHHHWDHRNGVEQLLANTAVPVYGLDKHNIPAITHTIHENSAIHLTELDLQLSVMEIPGHTLDHVAYYNSDIVFCGDTLFTGGCGKIFEGNAQQMYHSLQKLMTLPDDIKIYCGHEYTANNLKFAQAVEPENAALKKRIAGTAQLRAKNLPTVPSTLALEKATNPFLRAHLSQVRHAAEQHAGRSLPDPVIVFQTLREWKNHFLK